MMPETAEYWGQSGKILRASGKTAEARACFEKAIALAPHYAEAHMILGTIFGEAQEWERAAAHCAKAVALLPDSADVRRHFAHCFSGAAFRWIPEGVTDALRQCLRDPRLDSQDSARPAISILKLDPKPLENPLFAEVMARTVVADPDFELFLTKLRQELLLENTNASAAIWIALQCLNNEHVWAVTPREEATLKPDVIRLAMYQPISAWPAEFLSDLPAPLHERVRDWQEDRETRAMFTAAAPNEETTLRVKTQYEENPFPRWFSTTALPPLSVAELLRLQLPEFSPPQFYEGSPTMLIAGCGTGKEAIDMALRHPNAKITAIDISSASLSYALRMARKYELTNIEFQQLDLLDIACLERIFDLVECGGVLHHMADPFAGWKALLDVLRPGGLMYVALYSNLARRNIVSARARIASSGASLRDFRQAIIRDRESPESRELLTWPEFYSASGCRDLLFHVQERRLTIPEIREFLMAQELVFLGFLFRNPEVLAQYAAMFPRAETTDLGLWHTFELEHPDTFRNLYCFYCQKLS